MSGRCGEREGEAEITSDNSGAEEQDTHPPAGQVGLGDHSPLPGVCHYLVMCTGW